MRLCIHDRYDICIHRCVCTPIFATWRRTEKLCGIEPREPSLLTPRLLSIMDIDSVVLELSLLTCLSTLHANYVCEV